MTEQTLADLYRQFCQYVLAESKNPDSAVHRQGLCASLYTWGPCFGLNIHEHSELMDYQTMLFEEAGLYPEYPWNSKEAYKLVMYARQAMKGKRLEWVIRHAERA